jgi:itaconate CoA-transferase
MRHPLFCPYGPYPAAGGELFSIAVLSAEHWEGLCREVLDRPELLADHRYASNESRVTHRAELEPLLEEIFAARPASVWLDRLRAARIPCGSVNDLGEVMRHPQLEHNRLVTDAGSPAGRIPTIGNPFVLGGARPPVGAVPDLGEHTSTVLAELGLDEPNV